MFSMKKISISAVSTLLAVNVAYANFGDAVVGGMVGGAVGSVITNEVYNSNRASNRPPAQRHYKSKKRHKKYAIVPKDTPEMKIQRALTSLGFYHGKIDGEINSYETRSAIKELNRTYEIGNSASLKPETRDALIYLGTLFEFDRNLIARGTDKRTKGRKLQTALKIHGFYFSKIDGAVGPGTRKAIAEYKAANGLSYGSALDYEEEYQLISSAKQMNDKNIDDTIATLKGRGTGQTQAPTQPSVPPAAQAPTNNTILIK
ncbi:peptidoglycan-binding domain-containing protein [Sulfurovum lithotrophicum]|uniref:peptidoglycan-binding domain-containing protein n=1 Tax=Sulfurovum lithotrophicum TaxID=206403 RepID=UPI000A7A459B|nr:peptidoglycan-binding protein [Sulfurovum lithotrophicum]